MQLCAEVIMRIRNWERLNLMNRGMFAADVIERTSAVQILIGKKLEGSGHFSTKPFSVSSWQLFG